MMMNSTVFEMDSMDSNPSGLISDEDAVTMEYVLAYVMLTVSSVGVVFNVISIRTFVLMGLKDGFTVSLLGLSISDLGFTVLGCLLSGSNMIAAYEVKYGIKNLPVQPRIFTVFAANVCLIFYEATCMITTFLAVARCMCVAMPFRFKDFFTCSRCIVALIAFALVAIASYIPVLSNMGSRKKFDASVNRTRYVLWMSSKRSDFKDAASLIHFVLFGIVSSVIVLICVLIMAKHLKESVKFRNVSAPTTMTTTTTTSTSTGKAENESKDNSKLSGKELQVVRQVLLICVIYTVCLIPTLFYTVYRYTEDEFGVGKRFENLYYNTSRMKVILNLTNSATTFPVYYVYNTRFRSLCFSCSGNAKKISDH